MIERYGLFTARRPFMMLGACLLMIGTLFLAVSPTAWATPLDAPVRQTIPPVSGAGRPDEYQPPKLVDMAPYGGFRYYYTLGYGTGETCFYPSYGNGYFGPYYPGGSCYNIPPTRVYW
jgi:hypothetical protein